MHTWSFSLARQLESTPWSRREQKVLPLFDKESGNFFGAFSGVEKEIFRTLIIFGMPYELRWRTTQRCLPVPSHSSLAVMPGSASNTGNGHGRSVCMSRVLRLLSLVVRRPYMMESYSLPSTNFLKTLLVFPEFHRLGQCLDAVHILSSQQYSDVFISR